ncbi:type IX secretion system membrane protein PorP/SprF [Flavobacterium sp.]|uniref:PorP/SprF family type IX secretion system membrane protein n=1 Tax=Flavobacterium sp. TaxID=239 RepID=UPI002C4ADFF6|nr:type IX secretion system membrane protein PorP/SprF [Flavobacterium sp.]HSD06406.1 type IX secretion system membrane protein PorP/SprF [Flavobacterium sp.]
MIKKYILFVLLSSIITNAVNAQSDIKLNVQYFQPMVINPAYCGSFEGLAISGMYSSQWTGFEGAPKTQFLTANYRLNNDKMGLGLSIYNDKIGPVKETNVEGNYSYDVKLNDDLSLALGIKGGVNNFVIDFNKLDIENPGEIANAQGENSQLSPVIGAGMYLYTDKLFLGLSSPNMVKTKYYDEYKTSIATKNIYMYGDIGYLFQINYDFNITPILQYRYTANASSNVVFMTNVAWKDSLYGGINIAFNSSAGAYVGTRFLENFKFAYSYDSSLNDFSGYNGGNHTFILSYEFPTFRYHLERRSFNRF